MDETHTAPTQKNIERQMESNPRSTTDYVALGRFMWEFASKEVKRVARWRRLTTWDEMDPSTQYGMNSSREMGRKEWPRSAICGTKKGQGPMTPLHSPNPESEFQKVRRIMKPTPSDYDPGCPWTEQEFAAFAEKEALELQPDNDRWNFQSGSTNR